MLLCCIVVLHCCVDISCSVVLLSWCVVLCCCMILYSCVVVRDFLPWIYNENRRTRFWGVYYIPPKLSLTEAVFHREKRNRTLSARRVHLWTSSRATKGSLEWVALIQSTNFTVDFGPYWGTKSHPDDRICCPGSIGKVFLTIDLVDQVVDIFARGPGAQVSDRDQDVGDVKWQAQHIGARVGVAMVRGWCKLVAQTAQIDVFVETNTKLQDGVFGRWRKMYVSLGADRKSERTMWGWLQ